MDFDIAVVLRGVICSTDLARLVMHSVKNSADLTCSFDISFGFDDHIISSPNNLELIDQMPIPVDSLLRSRRLLQTACCDGAASVLSMNSLRRSGLVRENCGEGQSCEERNTRTNLCDYIQHDCKRSAKVMISPSVKSSRDPDDFRSALQLGFMDLRGHDYSPLAWEVSGSHSVTCT